MSDVIIIGSGYAGLAAGALLSRRGFRVQLLEKAAATGGRARGEERNGYLLDYGIHSHRLGEDGPLAQLFRELGIPLQFAGPSHVNAYAFQHDRLVEVPDTLARIYTSPVLKFPEKLKITSIMVRMMGASLEKWYPRTLAEFIRIPKITPGLQIMTTIMCLLVMAEKPESASAGEVIDLFRRAIFCKRKIGDPAGGSGRVIGILEKIISASGQIILNTQVTGFDLESGRIRAARTGQADYPARAFIYCAPVNGLTGLLPADLIPPDLTRFAVQLTSTSGLSIDFGLKSPVSDIQGGIYNLDPVVLGRFPSNVDPLRAPEGKQLSTWLRQISFPVNKEKIREAEDTIRGVIRKIFPGFFDQVEWERKLVHPVMDGLYMKPGQSSPVRPAPSVSTIPNLFLAGDTIQGKGSGGDIAFSSALTAADIITKYLGK